VPELDDLERALHDRAVVASRDGCGVVVWVEDHDQAAREAGPHLFDGLLASGDGKVDDHGVDPLGRHCRPGLDAQELGDQTRAMEQRSQGEAQRGLATEEHDMAGHAGWSLPGEDVGNTHDGWP
jgi:hypothetical protein